MYQVRQRLNSSGATREVNAKSSGDGRPAQDQPEHRTGDGWPAQGQPEHVQGARPPAAGAQIEDRPTPQARGNYGKANVPLGLIGERGANAWPKTLHIYIYV